MRTRSGSLRVVCLLIVVMGSIACSDNGSQTPPAAAEDQSSPATSPEGDTDRDENELKASVQAYSDAYLGGDADGGWALLSRRCRERITRIQFDAAVSTASETYDQASVIDFDAHISGDLARVSYSFAKYPDLAQDSEPWVIEDGRWREDDC